MQLTTTFRAHPFRWLFIGLVLLVIFLIATVRPVQGFLRDTFFEQEPFFFIQMTDPQLGMRANGENYNSDIKDYERAIAVVNQLDPAFVILTGDMTHISGAEDKTKKAVDPERVATFQRITNSLDSTIPLYLVPGNHEMRNTPTSEDIAKYRATFGNDYYSFNYSGVHFVALNSTIVWNSDDVQSEVQQQWDWLKQDLEKANADKMRSLVFQHHALFLKDIDEPNGYYNFSDKVRRSYADLFADNGVQAIFAGHYHGNSYGAAYRDMQMTTTSAVGKQKHDDKSGMRIIKVYPDRIEHEYITLDSPPDRIDL